MASTLTAPRFRALLIGAFAVTATTLAALGLYAAMAHFVERRRRELGIRMALGRILPMSSAWCSEWVEAVVEPALQSVCWQRCS